MTINSQIYVVSEHYSSHIVTQLSIISTVELNSLVGVILVAESVSPYNTRLYMIIRAINVLITMKTYLTSGLRLLEHRLEPELSLKSH